MKKKSGIICIFTLLCFCLTGCNDVYELTDDETKVIAEYAADLLLKYDISYDHRISEGEYKLEKKAEREKEYGISTTEEETTEELTEEITTEKPVGENVSGKLEDDANLPTGESAIKQTDIASIIGRQDISITYKDYLITKQYPTSDEGEFLYLDASDGYELLVLRFKITAIGDEAVNVSMIDEEINYKLVCNSSKAAKPMLTILMDDLGTLETVIDPNEEQEAVLVFQISDSMISTIDTIELFVNYNDIENMIEVQ